MTNTTKPGSEPAIKQAIEALEKFCRRVEAGEIRSKTSYAEFRAALAALLAASESGAPAEPSAPTDAEIEAAAARIAQRQGKRLSEMTRKEREAYRADAAAALDARSNADDR